MVMTKSVAANPSRQSTSALPRQRGGAQGGILFGQVAGQKGDEDDLHAANTRHIGDSEQGHPPIPGPVGVEPGRYSGGPARHVFAA